MSHFKQQNIGRDDSKATNYGDNSTINVNRGLTDEEWTLLDRFFTEKLKTTDPSSNHYKAYQQIEAMVQNRDEEKLSGMMKSIGKDVIVNVVAAGVSEAAQQTVIPILLGLL